MSKNHRPIRTLNVVEVVYSELFDDDKDDGKIG